ncbi:MAG: 50S ribosomal protein L5 [Endomicrobium sp.]|jgi:large subunit ribosomal protein L5|nr:50S ribosomal protein L5 [Endomicrobium sp.]
MIQARLKDIYFNDIREKIKKYFGLKNIYQVPKIIKVVLNIGIGEAKNNSKVLDIANKELAAITGQKPMICRAKKSISNFKIRKGMAIGVKVTLRDTIMYEFLDRLISIAIPRIRDFRGLSDKGFDGQGNLNIGIYEQYIFPEINVDRSDKSRGLNISVITNSKNEEQVKMLLKCLGFPFKKK